MKILVDLPDTTAAGFVNFVFADHEKKEFMMGCKQLDTDDLKQAREECQKTHPNGRWKEANTLQRSHQFICTACGKIAYFPQPTRDREWQKHCPYKYCPNCGAEMTEGKSE